MLTKRPVISFVLACGVFATAAVLPACSCSDDPAAGDGPDVGTQDGGAGAGGAGGADAGIPPVLDWHEPELSFRARVEVAPHPDRDRVDLPVLATVAHPGQFIDPDVRVFEVLSGSDTEAVAAGAWTQPDGTVFEVGFTAPGITPAGESRTFLVYYEPSASPIPWSWSDGEFTFSTLDDDGDQTIEGYRLSGHGHTLQRDINPADGTLRRGRRDDGRTYLELDGWRVAEGFSDQVQLESLTETFSTFSLEDEPVSNVGASSDAFSAAAAAAWLGRAAPIEHDAFSTVRVFEEWPFLESVVSTSIRDTSSSFQLSSADWSGRTLYLSDGYARMVSDNRGDEALDAVWDTSMRWLVVYDAGSDRGFGWFLNHKGVVRAADDSGDVSIYDSYGYAAAGETSWRYLWMASPHKDLIVDMFDAMKPGVTVSAAENRDLNILIPADGSFYFPEDLLDVVVTTPGSSAEVSASLEMADGTVVDVKLDDGAEPHVWRSSAALTLTDAHPTGTWTISAESTDAQASNTFEFRVPGHPHLLFSAAEVPGIQARRTDPSYAPIWEEMLKQASSYDDPIPDPGKGKDIRSYADRLINLALIQLVDPQQPYDTLLWNYFFTMLRYPNWHDGAGPFNNSDLTVGHFLTAISLAYDWHYDQLKPVERSEVRALLDDTAERWLSTSWMGIYRDIDWSSYGRVTNNHYWINHQGVAAAAFVLADEVPESRRGVWVDHTEENLGIILSVLDEDGTSHEGVPYHSYGQINLFRWIDMRDRALGGDTASSIPWFEQSVLFDLYSTLPGGDDNYGGVANFGDSPTRHYQPPRTVNAWLANRLRDGHAQWLATTSAWPQLTAMSYLWLDDTVTAEAPQSLPTWRHFEDKGIFAWRSSWDDDATYFSLKCGSYWGGHEQPDAGHFILHRAGVPYITDHGYSYDKVANEHNVVLVDGHDQHGGGAQWMSAVDPVYWGKLDVAVADDRYFDILADATAMSTSDQLELWRREVVGLGEGVFLVRDVVDGSQAMDVDWLLHSYRTDPPASAKATYDYRARRTENPWSDQGGGVWRIDPQDGALGLSVADLSSASWSAAIEPSLYVPEQNPDTGGYNDSFEYFQVGSQLHRSISASSTTSMMALWFGDGLVVDSGTAAGVEAVRLSGGGTDVVVLWPTSGASASAYGVVVGGAMGGRVLGRTFFGRGLTSLSNGSDALVASTQPADIFARLEHGFTASAPGSAVVSSAASTSVTLYCPQAPSDVRMDGAAASWSWNANVLSLDVPAGSHRFTVE
jgi:Domain of unknown function (DUF4962)/Heparinase II/III-like protein